MPLHFYFAASFVLKGAMGVMWEAKTHQLREATGMRAGEALEREGHEVA